MTRLQKWLLLASSGVMGATGLAYWWMKNRMEPLTEWAAINHPLQPWALKAHILAAPILVFAVGLIASDHIVKHARRSGLPGRTSGLTALWFLIPMALSGYLIQTLTHEGWLRALSWIHLITGMIYLTGLAIHQWVFGGRRRSGKEYQGERKTPTPRGEPARRESRTQKGEPGMAGEGRGGREARRGPARPGRPGEAGEIRRGPARPSEA